MKKDPWHKAHYSLDWAGRNLGFEVPFDVFSTLRIDEGTLLLLDNLPKGQPGKILDMGCGYGALGIPVAALHSDALVEMVDRDLLAVEWSKRNATKNSVKNVSVYGSLGFERVQSRDFDWILCNVPARIGKPFIEHIFSGGLRRLSKNGEIRAVVIRDLVPVLKEIGIASGYSLNEVASGPRHSVFSLASRVQQVSTGEEELQDLYLRDKVEISGVQFERPFDFGGDDPKRIRYSLPLLLDTLPRQMIPGDVLCVRGGYGVLPYLCSKKWHNARITVFDRDLIGLNFVRRNFDRLGWPTGARLVEGWFYPEVIQTGERFDLITLEISPSAGEAVAQEEITAAATRLKPGGVLTSVCLDKIWKEWIQSFSKVKTFPIRAMAARDGFTVFSLESRN